MCHKFIIMFENIIQSNGYFQPEHIIVDNIFLLNNLIKAICTNYHRLIPGKVQEVVIKIKEAEFCFRVIPTSHGVKMTLSPANVITFVIYHNCSLQYTFGLIPALKEIRDINNSQEKIEKIRTERLARMLLCEPEDINRSLYLIMEKYNNGVIPKTLGELYQIIEKVSNNDNLSYQDKTLLHHICRDYHYWYGKL